MDKLSEVVEYTLNSVSVFKQNNVFSLDYIPYSLPARERQVRELAINFKPLFTAPGSYSVRVVTVGKPGTGKTVTLRKFGAIFVQKSKEKNVRTVYTHINCYRQRTLYLVLSEIARQLNINIPNRGLSSQEVFRMIYDHLEKRNLHLIVTLDEFDYFINSVLPEDVYFLVRVYDELNVDTRRIHYIFVIKDLVSLSNLEASIKEHVLKSVVEFNPYTSAELYEILTERAKEAFRPGAVPDDTVSLIAGIYGADKGGSGNARLALETLELAGKIADAENSPLVTEEHVKKASIQINPELSDFIDYIRDLDLQQLAILKTLVNLYKKQGIDIFPMGVVEREYQNVAREIGIEPRRHTQLFEYIRRLKYIGLLSTKQSGKGMRGRSTLISAVVPINELEGIVEEEIKKRLNEVSEF